MSEIAKAKALLEVNRLATDLRWALRDAKAAGVSESALMATVHINQYSLSRMMEV